MMKEMTIIRGISVRFVDGKWYLSEYQYEIIIMLQ